MKTKEAYLPLLIETCREAGKAIMEIYRDKDFEIRLKADKSPVTTADMAAHRITLNKLIETEIPVLSEEAIVPYETRKNWKFFWLVDPIDGTKEFIKHNDEFTVNIALIEGTKPVLGIVFAPALGKYYYGGTEIGAFSFVESASEVRLKREPSTSNPRIAVSRSHLNQKTKDFIQTYKNAEIVPKGSSLKFMLLAENKIDIYPRFGPTWEWDTAASHAILNALGIEVYIAGTKEPLHYNKKDLKNPYFMVRR